MQKESYKKGRIVFRQGEPGDCMYYVRWGSVGVFLEYGTPREKQLATLHRGDYVGEMGLIDHAVRSATVVSLDSDTVLDRIGEAEFAEFLVDSPAKVQSIIARLSNKLRKVTKSYLEICKSVHDSVGPATVELDETSNYHFEDDAHLAAIHASVEQSTLQDA